MINGLAIWHYPHRTMEENIRYFAKQGYGAVSVHGAQFVAALAQGCGEALAQAVQDCGVILTVHYALPKTHDSENVLTYQHGINMLAAWQKTHGLIHILSFDVPTPIRNHIVPYLDYAMTQLSECLVTVEDFGLTTAEREQIEYLKDNSRFGYLIDIGHMFIRIGGRNKSGKPLFTHSPEECPVSENPGYDNFMMALSSKEFPIFEMHLHNNDGENDVHWFLENGSLDIPMIACVVQDLGFDGMMTIESAPGFKFECRGKNADDGIEKTFAYWKECCEKR